MTAQFDDVLIASVLDEHGLWLSPDQGPYGIHFDSTIPLEDAVTKLTSRFRTRHPWRVLDGETAFRDHEAVMTVVNEIDMSRNVFIRTRRQTY